MSDSKEFFENAKKEIMRADHLIFVSLKYTRTVDVIKHIIERLINCLDFTFTGILTSLIEKGQINEIPSAAIPKCDLLKKEFVSDEQIAKFVHFFFFLRKIDKAQFSRELEFRRHVTMTAFLADDQLVRIDIDIITDYFQQTKAFFEYVLSTHIYPKEKE